MKYLLVLVFSGLFFSQTCFADDCAMTVWINFECNCYSSTACDVEKDIIISAKYRNSSTVIYKDTILNLNINTTDYPVNLGTFPSGTCLVVTVESIDGCYYISQEVCLGFCPGIEPTATILVEQLCECDDERLGINSPMQYSLSQNYPNPFNPATNITYSLGLGGNVKIIVYDLLGTQVSELVNSYKDAGSYTVSFDASSLSSGVYYYKMESGSYSDVKKMLIIK